MLFVCHGRERAGELWRRDLDEGEAGCVGMDILHDHDSSCGLEIPFNNIPAGKKVQQACPAGRGERPQVRFSLGRTTDWEEPEEVLRLLREGGDRK